MFPLHDENPTELTPYVTIVLIALNVAAWVYLEGAGYDEQILYGTICDFGLIPAELTGMTAGFRGVEIAPGVPCVFQEGNWLSIITSMFLHGSWLHLIGNVWFLWVFGNNIEDSMGHFRFLCFYLICGVLAALAHIFYEPDSMIPTVGASGAISGVMGAYLILYPTVRVQTLFIFLFFVRIIPIPAWVVLIQWFVLQFLYWMTSIGSPATGGIAVWAHIGGFVAGVALVKVFESRKLVRARLEARLRRELHRGGPGHGGYWW